MAHQPTEVAPSYEVRWILRGVVTVLYSGSDYQAALPIYIRARDTRSGETYIKTLRAPA